MADCTCYCTECRAPGGDCQCADGPVIPEPAGSCPEHGYDDDSSDKTLAWLVTDPDLLPGEYCDVTFTRDGNVFGDAASTGVRADDEYVHDLAPADADRVLARRGWARTGDWLLYASGYVADVAQS